MMMWLLLDGYVELGAMIVATFWLAACCLLLAVVDRLVVVVMLRQIITWYGVALNGTRG